MENHKDLFDTITEAPLLLGAFKSGIVKTADIITDRAFRGMCESNACGMYGKCHMCPPDVGDIDSLIDEIKKYDYALVYQTVTELEDSFDFEGMIAARKAMPKISLNMRKFFKNMNISHVLHLGVGNCGVCEKCAKQTSEPCRFPDLALPSLEAYGVNVSKLAQSAGMKYINGQNTVTYFGAVLFSVDGE